LRYGNGRGVGCLGLTPGPSHCKRGHNGVGPSRLPLSSVAVRLGPVLTCSALCVSALRCVPLLFVVCVGGGGFREVNYTHTYTHDSRLTMHSEGSSGGILGVSGALSSTRVNSQTPLWGREETCLRWTRRCRVCVYSRCIPGFGFGFTQKVLLG